MYLACGWSSRNRAESKGYRAKMLNMCAYDMLYRYLLQNMDWLDEELGGYEDDYLIFDCPGASWVPITR